MNKLGSLVVCSLLAFSSSLIAQGEVDARSVVKKGAAVWLRHELKMDVSLALADREITTMQESVYHLHVQVTDVDADGNYLVETKIARVHGSLVMAMGQGDFEFDSAGETVEAGAAAAPPGFHEALTVGAGRTFSAKVSPAGIVISLDKSATEIAKTAQSSSMLQVSEGMLRQLVQTAFGVLPQKRTAAGAKWPHESVQFHGRMPTKQKLELTLSNVDPKFYEIEGSGTADLQKDILESGDAPEGSDLEEMKRQLASTTCKSGKVTKKLKMSREDGFVLEANEKMDVVYVTKQSQMGEVESTIQVTTKTTRSTAEAAMPKKAPSKEASKEAGKEKGGDGK